MARNGNEVMEKPKAKVLLPKVVFVCERWPQLKVVLEPLDYTNEKRTRIKGEHVFFRRTYKRIKRVGGPMGKDMIIQGGTLTLDPNIPEQAAQIEQIRSKQDYDKTGVGGPIVERTEAWLKEMVRRSSGLMNQLVNQGIPGGHNPADFIVQEEEPAEVEVESAEAQAEVEVEENSIPEQLPPIRARERIQPAPKDFFGDKPRAVRVPAKSGAKGRR